MINPKKVFLDRDGDGITDTVDLQLHLSPSCSHPTILSAVMDLAACLGFETMGMNFPLVKAGKRRDPSIHHHLFIGLNHELKEIHLKRKKKDFFLNEGDVDSLVKSINDFAFSLISRKASSQKGFSIIKDRKRRGFDLLNPFSNQGFYCKYFKNPQHIFSPYKILLFSHLKINAVAEAANFAARFGLESLSLSLPLSFPWVKRPKATENFIYIGKKEDLSRIVLRRSGYGFESDWKSGIFLLPSKNKIPDVLICGEEKGLEKILKHLSLIPMSSRGAEDPISRGVRKYFEELRGSISGRTVPKKLIVPEKIAREYTLNDEREEIIALLEKGLRNRTLKPDSVDLQIFLTRTEKARKNFEGEIREWLKRFEIPNEKVTVAVFNAYKPGLSWMREIVLKEISEMKIDRIEITFKEFQGKGLEESLRWLQEIYPIDEILSKALSIPKRKIEFKKDARIKEVYRIRAWHRKRIIYENQFSPKWASQPYLLRFPRLGKVNPGTGWITMKAGGKELVNQRVKTGIEQIWDIYQKKILSLIEEEATKVISTWRTFSPLPIFEELRFDIFFDYPMEPLGVDEERISPLEALHEDLYFVTLDFFSNWLKRKRFKGISLGRILPVIHPIFQGRNGRLKFTLVRQPVESYLQYRKRNEVKISLNGIVFNREKVGIDFSIDTEKEGKQGWLKKPLKSCNSLRNGNFRITKIIEENESSQRNFRFIAWGSHFAKQKKSKNKGERMPIEIPMERPIGYREGVRLIESLESLPGIKVVQEGYSSGGLPIFSIENTYPCSSHFVSNAKKIIFKPTFFINCRHHANEVSSTNAGLKLSYLLAAQPYVRRYLKKANVVINPMENVDGMVILDEMLKLTPTDKLHAARYNQAGREYYIEYFNLKTPFGEAKIKPAIWERWYPDICVDNHGFPSHEWDQPFSGYAPFQFREWWISKAFFFIYLPYIEENANSSRRIHAEALGKWITKNVSKERTITRWNHAFGERHWKYRGQWIQHELNRSGDPIPCFPLQKRFQRTNYSYQYPHITAVDFITEVADETARGEFLKACVSAHLKTNLAIIKLLNYLDFPVKKRCLKRSGEIHFIWHRERPLVFKDSWKGG